MRISGKTLIKFIGIPLGVVLLMAVGITVLGFYTSSHDVKSVSLVDNTSQTMPKPAVQKAEPVVASPVVQDTLPVASRPPTTRSQPTAQPQQDPSVCIDLASKEKADLASQNIQITQQLEVMRTLIGNSSLDNEIISRGGSISQVLNQNQLSESFDQASASVNSMIASYTTSKQAYQNQLLAAMCYKTLNSQLNG